MSATSWSGRVKRAREAEQLVQELERKQSRQGTSLNEAINQTLPKSKRSWAIRMWTRWKREGFEGLIDGRMPCESKLTRQCQELITGARLANPTLKINEAVKILMSSGVKKLPSSTTIKRLFQNADARRRYHEKLAESSGRTAPDEKDDSELGEASDVVSEPKEATSEKRLVEDLDLAGGELLKAAELETQGINALVDEVMVLSDEAKAASVGRRPKKDRSHRDRRGRFTAEYNQNRKRKEGEEVASYLLPAEEKARKKVPSGASFVHHKRKIISRKLSGLVFEPLINPMQGWNGLRSEQGSALGSLVGYPYMPATLQKLTSELAVAGAGPRLMEVVGKQWHEVAEQRWSEQGAMAALYVDNHAKEVWSTLFTKAGKVSHRSRVMPCITTSYVQTGAGTPVVVQSQSGSAPLAPQLFELVEHAEGLIGDEVRRAVVIDSECSVFDILESYRSQGRVIVTPCKPSRFKSLELHYSPGSYFRPYRDHDELRVATAILSHKSSGRELELGALLLRRKHRDSDFVLLTTGFELGMKGRELADLYFLRWPLQENFFKDGSALSLDRHRGNCGQIVSNVAIVTELEQLESRLISTEQQLGKLNRQSLKLEVEASSALAAHRGAKHDLEDTRQRFEHLVDQGQTETQAFTQAAVESHEASRRFEQTAPAMQETKEKLERTETRRQKAQEKIESLLDRVEKLEPLQKIRQLDIALDTILTAMKLTASLLILFVLREYMPSESLSTESFLNRVLTLRGRRETHLEHEHIVFYENPRDPRINTAVAEACTMLNERGLHRDGRALSYSVEKPP